MRPRSPIAAVAAVVASLGLVALARSGPPEGVATTPARAEVRPEVVAAQPDAGPPETAAARALRQGRPMDLNGASAEDLTLLPRIGPALAGRIVAWRDAHGPFESVDALTEVRGIGPRTLERLRPLVRVDPSPGPALGDRALDAPEALRAW